MSLLAASLWEKLERFDQSLFTKINNDWSNPVFNAVMPWLRYSAFWAPLYLFIGVFTVLNFRIRGLWWCIFFICTAAITDMTGNYIFKHTFQRLRPCNDPDFSPQVHLLISQCGAGYSFISNHAANHFGMAAFFYITFRHAWKKWAWIPFIWAAAIAYAQVYVGIHYPLDVFCGALLGLAMGYATATIFNKRFGFVTFDLQRDV